MSLQYEGGLHCEAIHGPSGMRLETDAPVDNHGRGEAFSPTDLCATSYGVCMMTVMAIYAQKIGIELKGATLKVRKIMTRTPPRRIARLEVDFHLPLAASHPACAALENAALTCPVALSLHPDIDKAVAFHWLG